MRRGNAVDPSFVLKRKKHWLYHTFSITWKAGYRLTWMAGYRLAFSIKWKENDRKSRKTSERLCRLPDAGYRLASSIKWRETPTWKAGCRLTWMAGYRLAFSMKWKEKRATIKNNDRKSLPVTRLPASGSHLRQNEQKHPNEKPATGLHEWPATGLHFRSNEKKKRSKVKNNDRKPATG